MKMRVATTIVSVGAVLALTLGGATAASAVASSVSPAYGSLASCQANQRQFKLMGHTIVIACNNDALGGFNSNRAGWWFMYRS